VIVIAYTITRISKGLLRERGGDVMDRTRREALHHVVQIAVYVLAGAVVLTLAGIPPSNLIVGAGAAGIVVGLAARQTLGAVFAGFVLLLSRPFDIGDWVVIDEVEGIVTDVSLFNTRLRTWDDEQVVVPNDEVTTTEIVNRSREGRLRITLDVGVDYDADVERAAEVAREAMTDLDPLMDDPAPHVVVKRFGDSAVVLELRFWISNPSARRRWVAQTAVIEAVKGAFDGEDVKIPFPQRELSGRGEEGLAVASGQPVSGTVPAPEED
jgi:small-conductance mechanosensitive channel